MLVDLLREGVKAGELPPSSDPELLADALVGPIVLRRLMYGERCAVAVVPALVEQILPTAVPPAQVEEVLSLRRRRGTVRLRPVGRCRP